jgi:hypothetical protein
MAVSGWPGFYVIPGFLKVCISRDSGRSRKAPYEIALAFTQGSLLQVKNQVIGPA